MTEASCCILASGASKKRVISGVAAAALVAVSSITNAQTAQSNAEKKTSDGQANGLETIVVTAQKRSENLQSVPIAISVLSTKSLENKGLKDISQLGGFAPNVEITPTSSFSGSTQVLSAYIRGIGQSDFAFNLDPGVGVYVDSVYYARTIGAVVGLLDLDHIEVLKGPQGTLFGRNTIGGAISVVTRDPANSFGGKFDVTYGRYNRVDVRGAVDIPLIDDKLLAQISASSKTQEGYFHFLKYPGNYVNDAGLNIVPSTKTSDTAGGINTQNIRAKLKWKISPVVTLRLTGDFMNSNDEGVPSQLLTVQPGLKDIYNTCINTPAATLATGPLNAICNTPRGNAAGPVNTPQLLPALGGANTDGNAANARLTFDNRFVPTQFDTSYSSGPSYSVAKTWGLSGVFDARLSKDLSLKSITAYRSLTSRFAQDADGSPIAIGDHAFSMNQTQFSQELQLLGSFLDNRLKAVTGLYYFHEQGDLTDYVNFADGLLQIYGPNRFKTSAYAAFEQVDFQVTEQLGFVAGGRYTIERKFFFGGQRDLNSLASKLGFPNAALPNPNDTTLYFPASNNYQTFRNFSGKLGINYKFTKKVLGYASFTQGFKSGGWTTRATVPILVAPTFGPETANTYELGLKGEFLDRTIRTNLAAFYTDYKNLQVTVYSGISPITQNAAKSRIKGFEAEVTVLPVTGLSVTGTLGYTDAKYTDKGSGTLLGNLFINTPKFEASLSADYELGLGKSGSLLFHGDYNHKSTIARDGQNTAQLVTPATDVVGALVSYKSPTRAWHLDAGVTNLTDTRYIISGQNQSGIGYIGGTYNQPRQWYATLGYKF